jgi:hypothetical protein
MVIEQPWARVKQPSTIPTPVTREVIAALPAAELAALVRDHLVPSGTTGPHRAAWDQFWGLLNDNDELAHRAFDVLEEFLDSTEDALDVADAGDAQRKRMQKFQLNAQNAWQRLQKDPPAGQRRLVAAIAAHRAAVLEDGPPTAADLQLWATAGVGGTAPAGRPR